MREVNNAMKREGNLYEEKNNNLPSENRRTPGQPGQYLSGSLVRHPTGTSDSDWLFPA